MFCEKVSQLTALKTGRRCCSPREQAARCYICRILTAISRFIKLRSFAFGNRRCVNAHTREAKDPAGLWWGTLRGENRTHNLAGQSDALAFLLRQRIRFFAMQSPRSTAVVPRAPQTKTISNAMSSVPTVRPYMYKNSIQYLYSQSAHGAHANCRVCRVFSTRPTLHLPRSGSHFTFACTSLLAPLP